MQAQQANAAASAAPQQTQPQPTRLLRRPEVEHRTGLSREGIYSRIRKGMFPPSRLLPSTQGTARIAVWVESEVEAWIQAQLAAADQEPQA